MEDIIYSADSLQIFWQPLLGSLLLIIIVFALVPKRLRQMDSGLERFLLGVTAGAVLLIGFVWLAITIYTQTMGTQVIAGRLTGKRIVVSNSARGTTSTVHRLYYGDLQAFDVASDTYDEMVEGKCYRVTYFPNFSFLSLLDQSENGFERTAFVSQIALVPPSRCS